MASLVELVKGLVSDINAKVENERTQATQDVMDQVSTAVAENFVAKAEMTNVATKSDLKDLAKKSDIPAAYDDSSVKSSISSLQGSLGEKVDKNGFIKNGYIYNSVDLSGGSNALLFNESDGGGAIFYNKENDIRSYAGVNDGMKDGSGVCALFYAVKYATGEGTRFSISPTKGAFYIKGPKGQGLPEGREVAVKDDIDSLVSEINALKARIEALEAANKTVENTEEP